jgi:phosphopantetheinyl transferase
MIRVYYTHAVAENISPAILEAWTTNDNLFSEYWTGKEAVIKAKAAVVTEI